MAGEECGGSKVVLLVTVVVEGENEVRQVEVTETVIEKDNQEENHHHQEGHHENQ